MNDIIKLVKHKGSGVKPVPFSLTRNKYSEASDGMETFENISVLLKYFYFCVLLL